MIVLLFIFSFFARPGILTGPSNFRMTCPDEEETCFFNLDLDRGKYMYVSMDAKDTVIFRVRGEDLFILQTNTEDFRVLE